MSCHAIPRTSLILAGTVVGSLCVGTGFAGVTFSSFASDLDGWSPGISTVISHQPAGGNPDGYMEVLDNGADANMSAFAPAKFLGDMSIYDGGAVVLNAQYFNAAPLEFNWGQMRITGAGITVEQDLVPEQHPFGSWKRYAYPLTHDAWGVTIEEWAAILADVTEVRLLLEGRAGDETHGLDNIMFTDCPSDLDHNGMTGFSDLLQVLASWGGCAGCPQDFDASGTVDFSDLLKVLSEWGTCPQ